ncbi:neuropeptide-like 1 isoform X2 [Neocloeon triangulifer]|uniref:neuropeptide-like 1 isoform X2 n=1 Tax=Neocloeon triangulifer TaxID=2078957 RepID=UPI00286F994F|nr:neuropeptide-like 1 isoform X2 [Neocloeon triangulifer]
MAHTAPLLIALLVALATSQAQGQDDDFLEDKRGISALARNGDLPGTVSYELKRFAHPLTWRKLEDEKRVAHPMSYQKPKEEQEKRFSHPVAEQWAYARDAELEAERQLLAELLLNDALEKRMGVASLARNNELPGKRNIAAMARDGYLTQHTRQPQDDNEDENELEEVEEKRNVAALARNFQMPAGGKRNLASRARSMSRYAAVKRNIATLLRSRVAGKRQPFAYARLSGVRDDEDEDDDEIEKRNIQALLRTMRPPGNARNRFARSFPPMMAALFTRGQKDESKRHLGSVLGGRRKRSALHDPLESIGGPFVEYPASLSTEYDYEEASAPMHEEKRFLGRIPHMGRTTSGRSSSGNAQSRRRPRQA